MQLLISSSIILICSLFFSISSHAASKTSKKAHANYIILFIWDGLRADAITPTSAPNLYSFMQKGTQFLDNHSTYPTFTMMNAASFATGNRAGNTGFYGNTLWHPGIKGDDADGHSVDFNQPVFTEDYKILQDLDQDTLFFSPTLFEKAHKLHIKTVALGKSGPAFLQDYRSLGSIFDEKHVFPRNLAYRLQREGHALPKNAPLAFKPNELKLFNTNGDPTAPDKIYYLSEGASSNPMNTAPSPYSRANEYMMQIFLTAIFPHEKPRLSVIWMRNPDTTEHIYGPGTPPYYKALHDNDKLLGQLIAKLNGLGLISQTDIIVVSDHAHSSVSGPLQQFPLRSLQHNKIGPISSKGYAVSGAIRVADLLSKAGFHAYDGEDCRYNPIMSGIDFKGNKIYSSRRVVSPTQCKKTLEKYTTRAYFIPKKLPPDAIIVAANGGSDYFYVPSHNKKIIQKLVRYLQSNLIFDVIFFDSTRYGNIDGALPLKSIGMQNNKGHAPDVVVGMHYETQAKINGFSGIEFSDSTNERGMHGSFSPIDVHNFLAACGPDFRIHFKDFFPSGNVDIVPTIAYLLNFSFNSEGRILYEALAGAKNYSYNIKPLNIKPMTIAKKLNVYNALGQHQSLDQYMALVKVKTLKINKNKYFYFDSAVGIRK